MRLKKISWSFLLMIFWFNQADPTPYITPEEWAEKYSKSQVPLPLTQISGADKIRPSEMMLDGGFSYMFEYIQIADFIASWQVADPLSPDFGGMMEGETAELAAIIQTDNTQEAIRVWAHYAAMTGDLERYRENIEAAWTYTMNFPAYSEEGETDYYRMHNCGWGLVAQMEYETVYGDLTYRDYADSCADFMITHPLSFSQGGTYYQQLHPLVAGYAAGTLYQYGQFYSVQAYIDTALVYGEQVMAWIEENPLRLSSNEVWAMSGGTAMWGVVQSVFREDPVAGAAWLETYAPYMDAYFAGPGSWNNSWNIWYAHAHQGIFEITGDSLYMSNAVWMVDTLLYQDYDNDGGIMAGSADPDSMDQTWVSCYTDYMGIEKILWTLPQNDVGILEFVSPVEGVPVNTHYDFIVEIVVANFGESLQDCVAVHLSSDPMVGGFYGNSVGNTTFYGVDTLEFTSYQHPSSGILTLTANTFLFGDENTTNDTLIMEVDVRGDGHLTGAIRDAESGEYISGMLNFYHQEVSDEEPYLSQVSVGPYAVNLMAGEYRIEVEPSIPYNIISFEGIEVIEGESTEFEMDLHAAPVLLVDDDGGHWYENYYFTPLTETGLEFYYWDYDEATVSDSELELFPIVLWFTGDEETGTVTEADKTELALFLEGGGNLVLTGQNIGDDLGAGDEFLNGYLKAEHETDDVNQQILNGVEGHPLSAGTGLFLIGAPGATNQTSPASCQPVNGGEAMYTYQNDPFPVGAVSYEDQIFGYKSVYFSFGLEAVSGLIGTLRAEELYAGIFEWFGFVAEVESGADLHPLSFRLNDPFPNPFNPAVRISFSIPVSGMTELSVFNTLGQQVALLHSGFQPAGSYSYVWNSGNASAHLTSGVYFCRLNSGEYSSVKKMVLVK